MLYAPMHNNKSGSWNLHSHGALIVPVNIVHPLQFKYNTIKRHKCFFCFSYTSCTGDTSNALLWFLLRLAVEKKPLLKSALRVYRTPCFQPLKLSRPIFLQVSVEIKIIYYWILTQCKKVHGPLHYEGDICCLSPAPQGSLCLPCLLLLVSVKVR